MKHSFLFIQFLAFSIAAQSVTVSKDSLKVYNNPAMSMIDVIIFRNAGSGSTFCDSAHIAIYQGDTSGGFSWDTSKVTVMFNEINHGIDMGIPNLSLREADSNEYRLTPLLRMKSEQAPFTMGPSGDSTVLSHLQIVNCPTCNVPKYPRYVKGVLRMFFHGGPVVAIKLYSQDLRTNATLAPPLLRSRGASSAARPRVLSNGQKIPLGAADKNRRGIHNRVCETNEK